MMISLSDEMDYGPWSECWFRLLPQANPNVYEDVSRSIKSKQDDYLDNTVELIQNEIDERYF